MTYADDDRCPQWGDLEGFQQQGLKRGRVMLFTDTLAIGVVGFSTGSINLERFLPKDQHTQRKFLNFENLTNKLIK